MALIHLDSFDSYATNDIVKGWRGDIGLTYFTIRDSGDPEYLLRPNSNVFENYGNYGWHVNNYLMSGERLDEILIGFKRKIFDSQEVRCVVIELSNQKGAQFSLQLHQDGSISAWRGSYVNNFLAVSKPDIVRNMVYQQFEIKIKVHDTAGYWYVRIDGEDVFSGENYDTRYQSLLSGVDRFGIGGQNGDPGSYEDLYVMNLSGEYNADWLDGARVDCLHPNAPGTNSDWTPDSGTNWDRVSDGGDVDDTQYVASSTDGHVDTYHVEDLEVLSGETTIHGVQVRMFATDDEISGELLPTFYDGTKYNGSGELATHNWSSSWALTTGNEPYSKAPHVWDRDPGGGAWSAATINSGEFGVELNIP